ncbi:MAG: tetratricopeptide repeat protein [Desulfobacterales bacterium]|nr:tetratricopeptide repeat protein [Desulfobacterales bacterium]
MNKLFSIVPVCFLFLFVIGLSPGFGRKYHSKAKYQTIAHKVLELETGSGIKPGTRLLDHIIDETRASVTVKSRYSETEAVNILRTVDHILINRNFLYYRKTSLLSEALKPRKPDWNTIQYIKQFDPGTDFENSVSSDRVIPPSHKHKIHALKHIRENFYYAECKTFSFIYLGIADALNLPVYMVLAPSHVFVRWHFGPGSYINWETTSGITVDDEHMKRLHDIPENSIRSGAYLRSLTRTESMATAFFMLGNYAKNPDTKIKYYTKAVRSNPMHSRAFYNLGTILYRKGMFDRALKDFDRVIVLEPSHYSAYNNRGNVWLEKGSFNRALADYNKTIELNPRHSRAYNNRGIIWYKKGKLDKALADYDKAIQSDPGYSGAYNNRGIIWYEKGRFKKALADYNKAVRLNPGNKEALRNRTEILKSRRNNPIFKY